MDSLQNRFISGRKENKAEKWINLQARKRRRKNIKQGIKRIKHY